MSEKLKDISNEDLLREVKTRLYKKEIKLQGSILFVKQGENISLAVELGDFIDECQVIKELREEIRFQKLELEHYQSQKRS